MPAIPVHHTATVDEAWDGPAAVASMPAEYADLYACNAWWSAEAEASSHEQGDEDVDDQKSSYKFPHHKTKGGPANLNACRNALARLESADIPDGDRAGVKRHVQAHLDDAGQHNQLDLELVNRLKTARPQAKLRQGRTDWFRIENAISSGTDTPVYVYDEIGYWGVSAADFVNAIQSIKTASISLHLNTPGGDAFDGITIMNALRDHSASVNVIVDGLAASAGTIIAMAGDTITMNPGSQMMIHEAAALQIGNAADMRQCADLLDKMSNNIADLYAARAGGIAEDWRTAMQAETWYTAQEAVDAGLADKVGGDDEPDQDDQVDNTWDLSIFAFAGRAKAPAPVPVNRVATAPKGKDEDEFTFDPELFREAIRNAASMTTREAAL
jgi:ATP-dependent protease ClpP protease subunit